MQYADGYVSKTKICCYISIKLTEGRYKDLLFISILVSKMLLHLKHFLQFASIYFELYLHGRFNLLSNLSKGLKKDMWLHTSFLDDIKLECNA